MRGFGEDSRTNVRRLGIFGERGYTASCWQIYKSSGIVGGGQRLQCSNTPPFSAYLRSTRYHEERQSALRRLSKGPLGKSLKVTMCANHSVIWILTAIAPVVRIHSRVESAFLRDSQPSAVISARNSIRSRWQLTQDVHRLRTTPVLPSYAPKSRIQG